MNNNINPGDIRYISFEGGGGKGAAYMGPLLTFLHPSFSIFKTRDSKTKFKIVNKDVIKGISGASAGAITAALLASGVTLEDIAMMIINRPLMASFNDLGSDKNLFSADVVDISTRETDYSFTKRYRNSAIVNSLPLEAAMRIHPYLPSPSLVDNFLYDHGLAPGKILRKHIDNMITEALYINHYRRRIPGVTFYDHFKLTGIELVLTAVNVTRRQLFYLSYKTTPNLRVADAVRMSLSIPGFFKPVLITKEQLQKRKYSELEHAILPGYWIDGGVVNNNPIHAFDVDERDNSKRMENHLTGKLNNNIFGIRLGKEVTEKVKTKSGEIRINSAIPPKDSVEFLKTVGNIIVDNSSELQFYNQSERDRVLDLTTTLDAKHKLSVLDFAPEPQTLRMVIKNCLLEAITYFNIPKSQSPAVIVSPSREIGHKKVAKTTNFKRLIYEKVKF